MKIKFEKGEFSLLLELLETSLKYQLIKNDLLKYVLIDLHLRLEKKERKQVTFKRSEAFALFLFLQDLELSNTSVQQVRNSIYNKFEKKCKNEQYL